jgi:hypothetical protein
MKRNKRNKGRPKAGQIFRNIAQSLLTSKKIASLMVVAIASEHQNASFTTYSSGIPSTVNQLHHSRRTQR